LFVADFHGGHRRQLTHSKVDVGYVAWIGGDSLLWTQGGDWLVSSITKFHPRKITLPEDAEKLRGTPRGVVVFYRWHQEEKPLAKAYVVTKTGIWTEGLGKWLDTANRRVGFRDNSGVSQCVTTDGHTFGLDVITEGVVNHWTVQFDKRTFVLPGDNLTWLDAEAFRGQTLYLRGRDVAGESHGRNDTIYALDVSSGGLSKIVGDLAGLDYSLDSPYYAGLTDGGMGLAPYGPRRTVWASSVYAGDVTTGKRWLILGGTVWAQSVAVQPETPSPRG